MKRILFSVALWGILVGDTARIGAQEDRDQELSAPTQEEFLTGLGSAMSALHKNFDQDGPAMGTAPDRPGENAQAFKFCSEKLAHSALGQAPDHAATACAGVSDTASVDAVISCVKRMKTEGVELNFLAVSCQGVRNDQDIDAVLACQQELKPSGEDEAHIVTGCTGVKDLNSAAAVAECHTDLTSIGEDKSHLSWACSGVKNSEGVKAVTACHKELKAIGEDESHRSTACSGTQSSRSVDTIVDCHKRMQQIGMDPKFVGVACKGVKDPAGVQAVAGCFQSMKGLGVDGAYNATACSGVKDQGSVAALTSCYSQLGGIGVSRQYRSVACNGVRTTADVRAVTDCQKQLRTKHVDPSYHAMACKADEKQQIQMAARLFGSGSGASEFRDAPAGTRKSGGMFIFSSDCAQVPAWLADSPPAAAGEFDLAGDTFLISRHAPKVGEEIDARDAGRHAITVRVYQVLDDGLQILNLQNNRTRRVRQCSAPPASRGG